MSTTNSKKDFFKPNHVLHKAKKSSSSDLEFARHEILQLETQNRTLKSEVQDLMLKNENLIEALDLNKERFEDDFNKLHEEIRQNENHLVENSRKCLDQQKKYAEEVRKLKQENENLKKSRFEAEKSFMEKLKGLESEIRILKLENENRQAQLQETEQKSLKYKSKLKHAVKIVNDMNQMVIQYRNKPENTCEMTQTDSEHNGEKTNIQDCSQCGDPRYKRDHKLSGVFCERDLNSENLILSDIFFKPKSFLDSELDLFAVKSKHRFTAKSDL